MPTTRITKASVDGIIPAASTSIHWDDRLKGFGLRVEPSGKKAYVLQYRMGGRGSPTRRYTIGSHGSPWTPATARAEAERLLRSIGSGIDPVETAKRQHQTERDLAFKPYAERFLEDYGRRHWRPRTWSSAESNLRRFVVPVLAKRSLPSIRRPDLVAVFDKLPAGSPALPRNVFALMRKLFSWACERGDIERSPFEGFRSPPSVPSRERVLSDRELVPFLLATSDVGTPFGEFLRLLILTGQRRDEIAGMRWEELDRAVATWSLPGARTKNGRNHQVPISTPFMRELDVIANQRPWPTAGYVFSTNGSTAVSGFSRMKRRLDHRVAERNGGEPLAQWRLHDLRRTMATGLQKLGIRFEVTEALLNHVSGARAGIAGVYQRHDWSTEKRQAMDAWAGHITKLLE